MDKLKIFDESASGLAPGEYAIGFLLNDKQNHAVDPIPFKIATSALEQIAKSSIGKPWIPGKRGEASLHIRKPGETDQSDAISWHEQYSGGTIVAYHINPENHNVSFIIKLKPGYKELIEENREIAEFLSPMLGDVMSDPRTGEVTGGTIVHIHSVDKSGYDPKVAKFSGLCTGPEGKCTSVLKSVAASGSNTAMLHAINSSGVTAQYDADSPRLDIEFYRPPTSLQVRSIKDFVARNRLEPHNVTIAIIGEAADRLGSRASLAASGVPIHVKTTADVNRARAVAIASTVCSLAASGYAPVRQKSIADDIANKLDSLAAAFRESDRLRDERGRWTKGTGAKKGAESDSDPGDSKEEDQSEHEYEIDQDVRDAFESAFIDLSLKDLSTKDGASFFVKSNGKYGGTSDYRARGHIDQVYQVLDKVSEHYADETPDGRRMRPWQVLEEVVMVTGMIRAAYLGGVLGLTLYHRPNSAQRASLRDFITHNNIEPDNISIRYREPGVDRERVERMIHRSIAASGDDIISTIITQCDSLAAAWDESKVNRGGDPKNPGRFSTKPGSKTGKSNTGRKDVPPPGSRGTSQMISHAGDSGDPSDGSRSKSDSADDADEKRREYLSNKRATNDTRDINREYRELVKSSKGLKVGTGSPKTGKWYNLEIPGHGKALYDEYGLNGQPVYIISKTNNTDGTFNDVTKKEFDESYKDGWDVGLGIWINPEDETDTYYDTSVYLSDISEEKALRYKREFNQKAITVIKPDGRHYFIGD